VTAIIKNGQEKSLVGYGIGAVLGRGNKLKVVSADLEFDVGSTAEWVQQVVGSVVGVIINKNDSSNYAIIKGVVSDVQLNMPYSQSLFFGTVGGASNQYVELDQVVTTVNGTYPVLAGKFDTGVVSGREGTNF
jgi:hypothetical protein